MNSPNGIVLSPGVYLVEMTTSRRGATADVVRRGLEAAGFSQVVSDEPDLVTVPPSVGATFANMASSAMMKVSSPAGVTPKVSDQAKAILSRPVSSTVPHAPAPRGLGGGGGGEAHFAAVARTTGTTPKVSTQAKAILSQPAAGKPQYKPRGLGGGAPGQEAEGSSGGGGGGGQEAAQAPDFVPDPEDDRFATDQNTGQEYYLDDQGSIWGVDQSQGQLFPVDQGSLQPTGGARQPAPPKGIPVGTAAGTISAADDLARPLGEDPSFAISIGGVHLSSDEDLYRFVAETPASVTLRPGLGVGWGARRLAVDPYADVAIRTQAFPLFRGITYDMVILGRDRRTRSRGDVWTLAEAMGFDMHEICLLRRDIHLPGRPNASYSRWLLVGTWRGPDTITTAEEPLVFEQVEAGADP